jgi:hypothetical protein
MNEQLSRREFFKKGNLSTLLREIHTACATRGDSREKELKRYFLSPLHSYPLLQEMPLEMLLGEARARGIPTDRRSKNEIARDLFISLDNAP